MKPVRRPSAPISENASLELAQARFVTAAIGIISETFKAEGPGPAICRFLREAIEICTKFDCSLVFPSHAADLRSILEEMRGATLEHFGAVVPRERIEVGIAAARGLIERLGRPNASLDERAIQLIDDQVDHVRALAMCVEIAVIDARILRRGDLHRKSQNATVSGPTGLH